ncbi:hypothetical protein BH11MYX1_BH11MYX1_39900 [soil metagenome]
MNRYTAIVAGVIAAAVASLVGCSSLVSDPCISGYHLVDGTCQVGRINTDPDGGVHQDTGVIIDPTDGGPQLTIDAPDASVAPDAAIPPDAMTCPLPTTKCGDTCVLLDSDPFNCGYCGHACQSGICVAGACVGDLAGNIVVIGHDYQVADPAMDRVVANGVSLNASPLTDVAVRVGYWRGTATQEGGKSAVQRGLAQSSRYAAASQVATVDALSLANLDAIVIAPQVGDGATAEAAGAQAASALATFLGAGHVIVVLETTGGVSYRYLHGAGLADLVAPVDASLTPVTVTAPADAVAQGVVSPYLAQPSSVGYPGAAHAVVTDGAGDAVVIHATY